VNYGGECRHHAQENITRFEKEPSLKPDKFYDGCVCSMDGGPAVLSNWCFDGFHPNGARDSEHVISNTAGSRRSFFSTVVDIGVVWFG
jgi:hypothetical protein